MQSRRDQFRRAWVAQCAERTHGCDSNAEGIILRGDLEYLRNRGSLAETSEGIERSNSQPFIPSPQAPHESADNPFVVRIPEVGDCGKLLAPVGARQHHEKRLYVSTLACLTCFARPVP